MRHRKDAKVNSTALRTAVSKSMRASSSDVVPTSWSSMNPRIDIAGRGAAATAPVFFVFSSAKRTPDCLIAEGIGAFRILETLFSLQNCAMALRATSSSSREVGLARALVVIETDLIASISTKLSKNRCREVVIAALALLHRVESLLASESVARSPATGSEIATTLVSTALFVPSTIPPLLIACKTLHASITAGRTSGPNVMLSAVGGRNRAGHSTWSIKLDGTMETILGCNCCMQRLS